MTKYRISKHSYVLRDENKSYIDNHYTIEYLLWGLFWIPLHEMNYLGDITKMIFDSKESAQQHIKVLKELEKLEE